MKKTAGLESPKGMGTALIFRSWGLFPALPLAFCMALGRHLPFLSLSFPMHEMRAAALTLLVLCFEVG